MKITWKASALLAITIAIIYLTASPFYGKGQYDCETPVFDSESAVTKKFFEVAIKNKMHLWTEERAISQLSSTYNIVRVETNGNLMFEDYDDFYRENSKNISVFFHNLPNLKRNDDIEYMDYGSITLTFNPRFRFANGEIGVLTSREIAPSAEYNCPKHDFDSCGNFYSSCAGDFLHSR